jgi:hypothetical protein
VKVPPLPGRSNPILVVFPVTAPVEVLVTVTDNKLLLSWVMVTVPVTPVFIPVKLKVSARAVTLTAISEIATAQVKSSFFIIEVSYLS